MTDEAGDILSEKLIIIGDYNGESNAIHEIVKAVKEAQVIQVSKSLMARNLTPPKVHGARAFLPFSGRKITIKQKNEDTLILRANVQKEVAKLSSDNEVFSSRKLELEPKVLDDFLSLLRLVQLGLIAQSTRFSSSQIDIEEAVPLSKIMIDAMKGLDWFLDGDSNEQEVNELLISVTGYHKMWLAKFEKALNEADLSPNLVNKDIDFRSFEYESRFCLIAGTADTIHPRDYLNEALDSSITTPIREVLFNGLRQLFVIESPPVTNTEVSWSIPSLSLKLDTEVDMYKSQRTEAERLLSLLGTNQTNERKTVTKILSDIKGKNRIKKLIDSPPSEISIRLNAILLSGNFDEIILERLSEQVPGVFKHLKKENDNQLTPKEIFTQTEYLRNQIVILDSVLSRIDKQIELLRSSKGGQKEAGQLQTSWAERRGEIQRLKANEQSIEAAEEEIDDLRKNILALETKLKHKQTNVKTDGSVLWLGLGQAGQSILRECLLYCLDNLNDARCSALIRSLGIQDVNVLNDMMLQSKSSDNATRTKAESGLQKLFHRQLHVLAMNLGGEIDDLVLPTEPGYFLWGDEFPESEYSTVRRKTINTIKLDPDQDGAGGKTGVGRAFAFGRENELRDALRDTGSKNGNSPSHIIVTHSFAGGSGSGMVLPVLQLLRSMFDSDAMIWVVSVGEGLSEQRISADYNTPFILSDVLQAHYDGIHSAINPFRVGEWSGYKHELEQYQTRMLKELEDLKALFADDSTGLKSIEEINQSKSLQINRIRDEGMKTLRRLIDKSDLEEFPRWKDADLEKKPFDLLPFEDNETDSFNAWCDKYDENGERPAVKFWNAWVNHVADPLGAVVDCRERGKQQRNKTDSSDGYVPNITSAHIQMALKGAKTKLFPEEKDDENIESVPKREKEHQNLRMLVMYLVNKINEKEDTYQMNETFQKVKEILESYGREVDGFNTLRRDLTNRVRALSKSGNDRGVKSIVISNAHLERGVSKSGIPVTENTYTVYNAVVFDVIMNIIGSQLPSTDYKSGKMEYFDRTDLDNHSLPPMVVGLLQQNDALSLAEPPITSLQSSSNVRTIKSNIHSSKVFDEIFGSNTLRLVKEKMNPFASVGFTSGGKPRLFFESYFGIRTQSMLNINPYDVVGVAPSEALQELTSAIDHHWNEPGEKIANIGHEERKSFSRDGFTNLSMNNMLRWLSLVKPETLKVCMGLESFKHQEELKAIHATLPSGFVFSEAEKNFELTGYEYESGSISVTRYGSLFADLGILNEELLAFAPPSLLSSYLPLMIMKERSENIVNSFKPSKLEEQYREALAHVITTELVVNGPIFDPMRIQQFMTIASTEFLSLSEAFASENLQISIVEIDNRETVEIRLHPRLTRYFSVFRDVVSKKSQFLFPSNSVAGSFSRYLAADSAESVIGTYSSPTFSRALENMEKLSFIGLLPDEQRLCWPSFLRMVLFTDNNSTTIEVKLKSLSESVGVDLSVFTPLIQKLSETYPLDKDTLRASDGPDSVVHLGKTIMNRMLSLEEIENIYQSQQEEEKHTLTHWKTRIEALREAEIEVFDEASLRYFVQFLLRLVKEETTSVSTENIIDSTPSSEEDEETNDELAREKQSSNDEDDSNYLKYDLVNIDRLLYEIATNLSEVLSQSEYMSKEHSADRVHFQMSGFSDRLVGKPKGLLIQVHTASTYEENFDMARTAIRSAIQQSIGFIENSKEFQTKSDFGPRASVTVSLSQAPLHEAATTYRGLMKKLAGNDPEAYIEETKLHPYVFLYNTLWLSVRLDKWTNLENTAFARQFVIPLQVIEDHYSNPKRIEGAVSVLVKDSTFLKGGVSVPQVDIRDYAASSKSEERYRSIPHLISILALRHVNTCKELAKQTNDAKFKSEVEEIQQTYSSEITNLLKDPVVLREGESKKGASAHMLLLENEEFGNQEAAPTPGTDKPDDPMAALMNALSATKEPSATSDTLLQRTRAWIEAHKNWTKWAEGKKR